MFLQGKTITREFVHIAEQEESTTRSGRKPGFVFWYQTSNKTESPVQDGTTFGNNTESFVSMK